MKLNIIFEYDDYSNFISIIIIFWIFINLNIKLFNFKNCIKIFLVK